jgi:hypothetical protein
MNHLVVAYGDKITSSKFEVIITELPSLIRCAAIDNSNFNACFYASHNVVVGIVCLPAFGFGALLMRCRPKVYISI